MIDWSKIDTVLLDMDGTLLDLHFDNHFWLHYIPDKYAEKNQLTENQARDVLFKGYHSLKGKLDWYCVDYWTEKLELDIEALKHELQHKIAIHPFVPEFLEALSENQKTSVLVTNAHRKSLDLKMKKTGLRGHFDHIITAHDLGLPKEDVKFWDVLKDKIWFDSDRTLFIDDSIAVLNSARQYGIRHLLAIHRPDSRQSAVDVEDYAAVASFEEIIPTKY